MFGAAQVSAQPTLRVTAANSSSPNALYDVLFGAQTNTLLNADGSSGAFQSFHSLVLVPNNDKRRRRCDRRRYRRRHDRALFRPDRHALGLLDGGVERLLEEPE